MMKPSQLALTFLEYAPRRVDAPDDTAELEELLQRAVEAGRAPWPQVTLPDEVFVRHLAERLPEANAELPLAQVLQKMDLGGLHLACACLHNVPEAIKTLESRYLAQLPGFLKQPTSVVDDVCQSVRIHLLVGTTESGPRLAEYKGRGKLMSWIQVIAVRMIPPPSKQVVSSPRSHEENLVAALEDLPAPGHDVDLELFKRHYRQEFLHALRNAFSALSTEQRSLLRRYFVDGLSTIELGKLFGVDQSTASRKLKKAREAVYEETKRFLQERLGLSSQEFKSLVAIVESQLDLSLSQFLKEQKE
jgi:RNA polymerase sigma-70 factor (ECF subfamily)